jgi:short-subunit dehydrogenase
MTKRVLITGAASGLGWEFAQQYQARGWHVILLDRDAAKLEQCDEQLRVAFHGVHPELRQGASDAPARDFAERNTTQFRHEIYCVDLLNIEQLDAELSEVFDKPLDLLINNAGITHRSQASVTDTEVFSRLMSVNWFAPVFLTLKCLPALQRAQGGVICISSMAAKMPVPGRAAYCASKSAMSQHFETWRPELLNRGIQLLLVYPSFLNTSIEANALGSVGEKTARSRSVVGAIQSPEEMTTMIIKAYDRGKQRLNTPQWSSRFAAWMWVCAPWLFQRLMWRKFAVELDS